MKKLYLAVFTLFFLFSCKNPAPDLSGNEKVKPEDFLKAFYTLKLPLVIYDSSLNTISDSTILSLPVFTQFVADSALSKFSVASGSNYTIHPAGIIHKKENDFLLTTFSSGKKTQLGVFVFDDKHNFLSSISLLDNTVKDGYTHSVSINDEPTFILKKEKLAPNSTSLYSRNGYAYSATSKSFSEVLHDSNEDTARINEIINPIDTFPQTNKYSGDYITDKKNFIAVRDGKNAQTYAFFIHFEKNNGDCVGELKGSMTLTGEKDAVFTESGDPCVINFKFTGNSIKIKEQGNCGNHRGITCPFDFTFKKKTPPKKKSK